MNKIVPINVVEMEDTEGDMLPSATISFICISFFEFSQYCITNKKFSLSVENVTRVLVHLG